MFGELLSLKTFSNGNSRIKINDQIIQPLFLGQFMFKKHNLIMINNSFVFTFLFNQIIHSGPLK